MSDVRIAIGMRDGATVTRVTAAPDGTEPSAWFELVVDIDKPNAYLEFMVLSSILDQEFIKVSNEAMNGFIDSLIEANPGVADLVRDDVYDSARLAGFSEDDAAELRDSL
jgi:hypothetical protein